MPPPAPAGRSRAVCKVLLLTLLLNLAVSGGKILVGMPSGSLAMVAAGYCSLLDGADNLTLRAAHEVADRIERELTHACQEIVDVVVHLKPA